MLWKFGLAILGVLFLSLGTVTVILLRAITDTLEEACCWLRVLRAESRATEKALEWNGNRILLQDTDNRPKAV